jgi:hypothetical protein
VFLLAPFHSRLDREGFETKPDRDHQRRSWSDFRGWFETHLDRYHISTTGDVPQTLKQNRIPLR